MKINDLIFSSLMQAIPQSPAQGSADFAQCLKGLLTDNTQAPQSTVTAATSQANPLDISAFLAKPIQALEDSLSHLEQFQTGLGNLDNTLKSLEPYLENLEKDVKQMETWVQTLPADSPLRSLLDEAATLSATTAYKFQRGDFV